ncbi:ribokinase [Caldicoprobacter guelmensis]|uniref:ribokinase n=1 Tax=Caldicoprobacter guelmensis TaxID=1170224 RepID=UPI00195A6645|nr:ribokinase [Caldicoprobacter guelmensis]MBM7582958.1 ribokinase [Caldicoprobacter guelmensis]
MLKVGVVGSINTDLIVKARRMPQKGETIIGDKFLMFPGGKGANQAVAVSRLGVETFMFGSVGDDNNGSYMLDVLRSEKVNTSFIQKVEGEKTGVAIIYISELENDNRIVVIPGANQKTTVEYVKQIEDYLIQADIFLIQMEIPLETIEYVVDFLYRNKKIIILNPAPAMKLSEEIVEKVNFITPNEHECSIVFDYTKKREELMRRFPNKLIVTEGEKGVRFFDGNRIIHIPALNVDVVDTTGAGDAFNGAFAAALAEGKSLYHAVKFANVAAGLSVTKIGAQAGMVDREQIEKYIRQWGI